jgi:hypothetical protein
MRSKPEQAASPSSTPTISPSGSFYSNTSKTPPTQRRDKDKFDELKQQSMHDISVKQARKARASTIVQNNSKESKPVIMISGSGRYSRVLEHRN